MDEIDETEFDAWYETRKRRLRYTVAGGILVAVAVSAFLIGRSSVDPAAPSPAMTPCGTTGAMCPVQENQQAAPPTQPDAGQRIAEQHRQAVLACEAQAVANNGGQPLTESQNIACSTIP